MWFFKPKKAPDIEARLNEIDLFRNLLIEVLEEGEGETLENAIEILNGVLDTRVQELRKGVTQ